MDVLLIHEYEAGADYSSRLCGWTEAERELSRAAESGCVCSTWNI
jgi:hypothetical protein